MFVLQHPKLGRTTELSYRSEEVIGFRKFTQVTLCFVLLDAKKRFGISRQLSANWERYYSNEVTRELLYFLLFLFHKPSRSTRRRCFSENSPVNLLSVPVLLKNTMSENACTESCLEAKADVAHEDGKDRRVDIYVSAESLKVHETPWVEDTPAAFGSQPSGRRETHTTHRFEWFFVVLLFAFHSVIHVGVSLIVRLLMWWFGLTFVNVCQHHVTTQTQR